MDLDQRTDGWKNLDEAGLFPAPDENEPDFLTRVKALQAWSAELDHRDLLLPEAGTGLSKANKISREKLREKGQFALSQYGFCADWVPAYCEDRGLPFLTGGMAVVFKENETSYWKTFFQLKSVYKTREKWLIYDSAEIVSHEMCHVARSPLGSRRYEEYFAYQTSTSRFRRWLGGALLSPKDNMILLGAIFWLLAVDLWTIFIQTDLPGLSWVGLLPLLVVVFLGLLRNHNIQGEVRRARIVLERFFGAGAGLVLFRLTDAEITRLSKMDPRDFDNFWNSLPGFRGEFLRGLYRTLNI